MHVHTCLHPPSKSVKAYSKATQGVPRRSLHAAEVRQLQIFSKTLFVTVENEGVFKSSLHK